MGTLCAQTTVQTLFFTSFRCTPPLCRSAVSNPDISHFHFGSIFKVGMIVFAPCALQKLSITFALRVLKAVQVHWLPVVVPCLLGRQAAMQLPNISAVSTCKRGMGHCFERSVRVWLNCTFSASRGALINTKCEKQRGEI